MGRNHNLIVSVLFAIAVGWIIFFIGPHPFDAKGVDPQNTATADQYQKTVKPFFQTYCLKCHGPEKSRGNLDLNTLEDLGQGKDLERWESILKKLDSGEMPPKGKPQPKKTERRAIVSWIETQVASLSEKAAPAEVVPTARRLTNFEYQNTMRDLLGIELNFMDDLPKDPLEPYAFNNTAKLMHLGPEQINRYLECARRAMASVIVDPKKPEVHKTRREWKAHGTDQGLGGDEVGVWGNRRNTPASGMGLRTFPRTGEFRIRVKASAILPPGISELPFRLVMGYGLGVNSSTLQVEPVGTIQLRNSPDDPQVFEFRGRMENHPVEPGIVSKGKRLPDKMTITPQNLYDDGTLNDGRRDLAMPRAIVEWMEFEAPIVGVWPPKHHTDILFESPSRSNDPQAYVEEVLKRFMTRAYRRAVSNEEVARFAKIHEIISKNSLTLEASIRETLSMVLVSPQFLYHNVSMDSEESQQYALASRLSYFLWGSMPDAELFKLASEGKLNDPKIIDKQVSRMLVDDRALDFVDNFTTQWLSLSKLKNVPINRSLFPRFLYYIDRGERAGTEVPYRPTIRDFMHQETVGFVAELIKRNRSVLNIVDADFAILNQPLAAHYGVEGVQGQVLRPVPLKNVPHLGGLLTQGSVLIGNGTGTAPHPIYRAVWLREAILGEEVPPPPAEVPALSDSAGESADKALSIKDHLAKHRENQSCNHCHSRLDPWGIPFERYNAIGKFQPMVPKEGTRVAGFNKNTHKNLEGYLNYLNSINTVKIEADAQLPNGPYIDGMAELKGYLLKHRKEDIAENVLRKLLSYGLGRELSLRDRIAVKNLMNQAKDRDYRLRDMIVLICQSKTFRGN